MAAPGETFTFLEMTEHLRAADLTPQKLPEQLELVETLGGTGSQGFTPEVKPAWGEASHCIGVRWGSRLCSGLSFPFGSCINSRGIGTSCIPNSSP